MEHTIQSTVLKNLLYNEEFTRRAIPFLKMEYFEGPYRSVFNLIVKFVSKYNKLPTSETLMIDFQNDETINNQEAESMLPVLQEISEYTPSEDRWLIETTEKWCQDRAIYLAIMESINIIDGKHKTLTKNSLPHLLSEALTVSFDNNIGHDYIKDSSKRYNFYHQEESKIPFDLELFNTITKGGLPSKTLNIALAGCVHPQTKIDIQFRKSIPEPFIQKEICIAEVQTLLENGYFVEVDSPDGYVPVNFFIHKGIYEEFVLTLHSSNEKIYCNRDHLFETRDGWVSASQLLEYDHDVDFLTKNGFEKGYVSTTGKFIPIVDINVQSENHRYYTSGVSSHNTGVGKSLFMCHVAASILLQGKNVLYITMEMSEERIAERIDANLMNLPLEQIETLSKKEFETRVSKITSKNIGRLIIKEYPTSTAHTGHFRALLNELRMKKDFVPDIIFIDYMNICTSSRIKSMGASVNSYSFIKSIAEEIRGLAVEFNVPIVSATQTTRSGFCLDPNTRVISPEGEKLLKEVKVGDKLLSIDGWNTVNHVFPETVKKPFRIMTSLGNEIFCSKDHKFPVINDWIVEKSIQTGLKVNERLIVKNSHIQSDLIVLIEECQEEKALIDIEVDGNHLFYANNILTHNSNTDVGLEDTSECIFVDEEVILRDGTRIPIKEIRFGDQIRSNDEYKTVLQVHHIKPKECVKITLKSGKQIRVSKDHVFPTNRGRNSVKTGLKVGDKLSTTDSKKG